MFPPARIGKIAGVMLAVAVASTVNLLAGSGPGPSTGVFINQRELTPAEVMAMNRLYQNPTPRGRFWYDPVSGLWGVWGFEAAGFIRPGHDFGPMPSTASAGNTGVFLNGRQLNSPELLFFQLLLDGQVGRGRIWLDGRTWNMGNEGSSIPLANLGLAILRAQAIYAQAGYGQGQGRHWSWRDGSGTGMASDGNCAMIAVPGAPVYSNGC